MCAGVGECVIVIADSAAELLRVVCPHAPQRDSSPTYPVCQQVPLSGGQWKLSSSVEVSVSTRNALTSFRRISLARPSMSSMNITTCGRR